jgi:hypothetical protein
MRLVCVALVASALLSVRAGAEQFQSVPLTAATLSVQAPDGAINQIVGAPPPFVLPWSNTTGGSGTLSVSIAGGEIAVYVAANLPAGSSADLHASGDLELIVPYLGSALTSVVWTFDRVVSDRAQTLSTRAIDTSSGNPYSSLLLGAVVSSGRSGRVEAVSDPVNPLNLLTDFIPGDTVILLQNQQADPSALGSFPIRVSVAYDNPSGLAESFTEAFRLRAAAVLPDQGAVVSTLPGWGLPLVAGLLLGASLRLRAGAP